jgi:hypothetical protein
MLQIVILLVPIVFAVLGIVYPNPANPVVYGTFVVFSIVFAVFGMLPVTANVWSIVHETRQQKLPPLERKHISMVPFFGGLFIAVAFLTQPSIIPKYYFWTAFIIDFTWILCPPALYYAFRETENDGTARETNVKSDEHVQRAGDEAHVK